MELKTVRVEPDAKPKKTEVKKINELLEKNESVILYFDRDNSHKDLLELQDYYEAEGKSFYMREIKYGLSENEYMYEVHIL